MKLPFRRAADSTDREYLVARFCMDPTEKHARSLDTQQLHAVVIRHAERGQDGAAEMAQAELRRREAWSSPSGWAIWISLGALLVSLCAAAVSIWSGVRPAPLPLIQPSGQSHNQPYASPQRIAPGGERATRG